VDKLLSVDGRKLAARLEPQVNAFVNDFAENTCGHLNILKKILEKI